MAEVVRFQKPLGADDLKRVRKVKDLMEEAVKELRLLNDSGVAVAFNINMNPTTGKVELLAFTATAAIDLEAMNN